MSKERNYKFETLQLHVDTFYNLMKKVLNTLLAVQALLFVFALNPSVRVKD